VRLRLVPVTAVRWWGEGEGPGKEAMEKEIFI